MTHTAEYHYRRSDGLYTYASGRLTTGHAASSYGLPVLLVESSYRTDDPIRDGVYGPGDLPEGKLLIVSSYPALEEELEARRLALSAGWSRVELSEPGP